MSKITDEQMDAIQARTEKQTETGLMYLGGAVWIAIIFAWIFDLGPFGWFDGDDTPVQSTAETSSAPKNYYLRVGGGICTSETAAKTLVRAAGNNDTATISRLIVNGSCVPIETAQRVERISGLSIMQIRLPDGTIWWTGSGAVTRR